MKKIIWLMIFSVNCTYAGMEDLYLEGQDYAGQNKPNKELIANTKLAKEIPAFASSDPKEANFYNNANLEKIATDLLNTNEAGSFLMESSNKRQKFVVDPKNDPLFKQNSDLDLNVAKKPATTEVIEKFCEEGGEEVIHECLENRIVTVNVPIKTVTLDVNHLAFSPTYRQETYVVKKGNFWRHTQYGTRNVLSGYVISLPKEINAFKDVFCKGFKGQDCVTGTIFNIDCNRIIAFKINSGSITSNDPNFIISSNTASLNITLKHKTYENEAIDDWTGCNHFESMVNDGLCQYGERILTEGPATRNINSYPIFKQDWQYKQIYNCKMLKDECSPLRAQGCVQIGSSCKEYRQNKCWIYNQKYNCPNGKLSLSKFNSTSKIFCITGNCHDTSFEANADMLDVIAKLNLLKEVQDDMRAQNNSDNLQIFKGRQCQCSRNCINFKDCCGGMKGWGVSFNLANCKPEERELAQMRQKNLCHHIGTYCHKKILGKCVTKKTSFCCFGTRFAKVLHEQGRSQLGIGWGDPKCPNCRALTIEQLSRLDLSQMNFSELFADIMQKYKSPDVEKLQNITNQKIAENLGNIEKRVKSDLPNIKKGVVSDKKDSL